MRSNLYKYSLFILRFAHPSVAFRYRRFACCWFLVLFSPIRIGCGASGGVVHVPGAHFIATGASCGFLCVYCVCALANEMKMSCDMALSLCGLFVWVEGTGFSWGCKRSSVEATQGELLSVFTNIRDCAQLCASFRFALSLGHCNRRRVGAFDVSLSRSQRLPAFTDKHCWCSPPQTYLLCTSRKIRMDWSVHTFRVS